MKREPGELAVCQPSGWGGVLPAVGVRVRQLRTRGVFGVRFRIEASLGKSVV